MERILKPVRLYVSSSNACPSMLENTFCVFEDHIVYRVKQGTFAIHHLDLEGRHAANAVDGFLVTRHIISQALIEYRFLGELDLQDLVRLRKRIALLC